jgi:hypothetical protein
MGHCFVSCAMHAHAPSASTSTMPSEQTAPSLASSPRDCSLHVASVGGFVSVGERVRVVDRQQRSRVKPSDQHDKPSTLRSVLQHWSQGKTLLQQLASMLRAQEGPSPRKLRAGALEEDDPLGGYVSSGIGSSVGASLGR